MSDIIKMAESSGLKKIGKEKNDEIISQDITNIAQKVEANRIEMAKLYNRGITLISDAFNQIRENKNIDFSQALDFTRTLLDTILIEGDEQLSGFYEIISADNYLPSHSMNVSILSTKIGMWLGLNKSELTELIASALFHDLGMIKVEDIVQKEGRLGMAERMKVEKHPEYSEEILRTTNYLNEEGLLSVKTHHYRGPRPRFSHIIGLADIYEAITHPRMYKKAKAPHKAIGEIIEKEGLSFQADVIKTFVNNIGVYPVGSWVKLSTGEIGIVIEANKGYPLSPKVHVMFNHLSEQIKNRKIVDFMKESYFYIEGPVDITEKEEAISEAKNDENEDSLLKTWGSLSNS